jgi:hypothetical protein
MLTISDEISLVFPDKKATDVSNFSAMDIKTCGEGLRSPASDQGGTEPPMKVRVIEKPEI